MQGYFKNIEGNYEPIDKITKEELLQLVEQVLVEEEIELTEYDEEQIGNPAHQIIYKSVYDNLTDLRLRKDEFIDESETLFHEDYERYKKDGEIDSDD